jgi:hypothetical protein
MIVELALTSGLGSPFDYVVRYGLGWNWNGFGLACEESYDLKNPFVDHTLRLIQLNWVVLSYNYNIDDRC